MSFWSKGNRSRRSVPFGLTAAAVLLLSDPLLCAAESEPSSGENLIPNPSFEIADANAPAYWAQRTPSDEQRTLVWSDDAARTGARSLKIVNRADVLSRWRTGHLRDIAIEPGSEATLSGWVRTKDVRGNAHFRFYCLREDGHILAQPQTSGVSGTAEWREARLTHRIPPETAYVMVYPEITGPGTTWFDDVMLTGKAVEATAKSPLRATVLYADEFEYIEGFVLSTHRRRSCLELPKSVRTGRGTAVYWGQTAQCDLAVTYHDASSGASTLEVVVNDREIAAFRFDEIPATSQPKDSLRTKTFQDVDLQRLSRITLIGTADGAERCRIHKVTLTPTGRFEGEFLPAEVLRPPPTLRLYLTPEKRREARAALLRSFNKIRAEASSRRNKALASLKTPEDFRTYQQRVRRRLPMIFGDFKPKCPLKPRIVGRLDRPQYVIEKLIFESQPNYHCTANVYVPKGREFPQPGVLFTCGHASDGKAYHLYHDACLGLVLKGYVVLALDPTGQGERYEYFDPQTGKATVPPCVAHHHYLGRPSWLVGRTLAGYRTWDCVRALDYLVARPEVDADRIAAVGNSGGGIMALLITAADERIRVCAAAHPGGSMEESYLTGRWVPEADLFTLIPPRPCRIVVGDRSDEEAGHRRKLAEMLRFYRGLKVGEERGELVLVPGVHNMKQPKREACYAWVNRWFDRADEGKDEPPLRTEKVETLRCTESGRVVQDLGGETGQSLNAKIAESLCDSRTPPRDRTALEAYRTGLRRTIAERIGLRLQTDRPPPPCRDQGRFEAGDFVAEKLLIESEPGIDMPALLMAPTRKQAERPFVLHVSELGKPVSADSRDDLALALVRSGCRVLSVDVRGAGEIDPRRRRRLKPLTHYDPEQWRFDDAAICAAYANTTMLTLRTRDVIRAIDVLEDREDLDVARLVLVGEGLGGVWALTAAAFDDRVPAVACVGMVPSYRLIVEAKYYTVRDYFWVPGALQDFDLPGLFGLVAPRRAALISPIDAMRAPLGSDRLASICRVPRRAYSLLGAEEGLQVVRLSDASAERFASAIVDKLAAGSETR